MNGNGRGFIQRSGWVDYTQNPRLELMGNFKHGWIGLQLWKLYLCLAWQPTFPSLGATLSVSPMSIRFGLHLGPLQPFVSIGTWSKYPDQDGQLPASEVASFGPVYAKVAVNENLAVIGAMVRAHEYGIELSLMLTFWTFELGFRWR